MEENSSASLNVLLTGATEGLGRTLTQALVAGGHQVSGIARTLDEANQIRSDGGLPVYCDVFRAGEIASAIKMAGVNVVVNAAPQYVNGLPIHRPDWDYYVRLLRDGAAACAQGAADGGADFVVHTSFVFLYGEGEMVEEQAHIETQDTLFAAAADGEKAVLAGETPACVLRAGFNYGPGIASLQALHRALMNRGVPDLGSADSSASWVHEADLAAAVVRAAEQQPAGEIFNIVDASIHSPLAFANTFAAQLDVLPPRPVSLPSFVRQFTSDASNRAILATSVTASAAKAQESLGWTPSYATVETGLEQTLLAWRAAQVS